jgi:uncharacterized protein (DUF1330 family)
MSAYLIAEVDVTDPLRYDEYRRLSSLAIAAHGAKVLVRGGAVTTLEGDWSPKRVVVLEFADADSARRFYASVEYSAARSAREGAASMRMIVVEGIA